MKRTEDEKICPRCGSKMELISSGIGGFASHAFLHSAPPKHRCQNGKCGYKEEPRATEAEDTIIGDRGGRT
jgi:ribosomal protein S27AE